MNAPFLTAQLLADCTGATLLRAGLFSPHLAASMARWGIDTPTRQAAFLAQIGHESMRLTRLTESLDYSVDALLAKFERHRISEADARRLGRTASQKADQEQLANTLYGGAWGLKNLGNTLPGDGWLFRGRGLKQLTGRGNYTEYERASSYPVTAYPDLLLDYKVAADSAGWFWHWKGCNALADKRDWTTLTKRINGGTVGLQERIALTTKALKAFSVV